jgi:acyl-CoA thioester hydrolase
MNEVAMWRGQVPAWECDAGGRWNVRHLAGAFDEAVRAAGGAAMAGGELVVRMIAEAPVAGALVEVRGSTRNGHAVQRLVMFPGGAPIAELCLPAGALCEQSANDEDIPGSIDIVRPWETDVMGHMNVQFYAGRVTSTEALLVGSGGAGQDKVVRPVEQRFRFAGELKAGEMVSTRSEVLDRRNGAVRMEIAGDAGRPAAIVESDLATADGSPIGDLLPRDCLHGNTFDPVWIAGEWAPDLALQPRMFVLGRQEVAAWEADYTGVMPPRFFFARMAGGVPYLLGRMGLDRPYMVAHGYGRAAVGYRIRYLRWPRIGDCIELRSGIGLVRERNWRFRHAFVDMSDGGIVCFSEAVIVLFDLASRRSAPLPDAIRDRAAALQI